MSQTRLRVAVVFNEPVLSAGHHDALSEGDVAEVARAVAESLAASAIEAILIPAAPPLAEFLGRLAGAAPDLVFNLIEGFGGVTAAEAYVTSVYELLSLPYTGSPVEALALCHSKARTKAVLRGEGLPTPWDCVVGRRGPIPRFEWQGPVLVKPDAEDGSLGIDQESVVTEPNDLPGRVERLREAYGGSVLIESYLPGPEYNVGVLALPDAKPLPVAEVVFAPRPGSWPILTYAAKWDAGSEEDLASPVVCPAPIEHALASRLGELAVSAFHATGCRDYARVDFRLDGRGEPMILEVNPNPDIGPQAGWARASRAAGLDYAGVVAALARQAYARGVRG